MARIQIFIQTDAHQFQSYMREHDGNTDAWTPAADDLPENQNTLMMYLKYLSKGFQKFSPLLRDIKKKYNG